MIDLTPFINAFIAVLTAVLIRFLVPWIKSKLSEQGREDLLQWVRIAVAAAQQTLYQMDGPQRKEYVLEFLAEHGFDVDDSEVDAAIEAAVLQLHHAMDGGGV